MNKVAGVELSRTAVLLGERICAEYNREHVKRIADALFETEKMALALFIWKSLCKLKECGQMQIHPEDWSQCVLWNFRNYEYRGYPFALDLLMRAFARQIGDFDNLPRKTFYPAVGHTLWRFYNTGERSNVAQFDGWCRHFFIRNVPALKEFGDWFVGEYWYEEDSEQHREVIVVPFKTQEEAEFFLLQLADSLNSTNESGCHLAAQFIHDVVAQAPVEEMKIKLEQEAAREAERREKERMIASHGTHVYILDFGNGLIKIGVSRNVRNRIAAARTFGQATARYAVTKEGFEFSAACDIESKCHNLFKDKSVSKEVFRVTYAKAKTYLETLAPIVEL